MPSRIAVTGSTFFAEFNLLILFYFFLFDRRLPG